MIDAELVAVADIVLDPVLDMEDVADEVADNDTVEVSLALTDELAVEVSVVDGEVASQPKYVPLN